MNTLLEQHIAIEGKDNALKLAAVLMENNYQVFIQLDDCDIYVVSWAHNDLCFGSNRFASITEEEEEMIQDRRQCEQDDAACKRAEELRAEWVEDPTPADYDDVNRF